MFAYHILYTNDILLCYWAITIIHQYFIPCSLRNKLCLWYQRSTTNTHGKTLLEYYIAIVYSSLNYKYY